MMPKTKTQAEPTKTTAGNGAQTKGKGKTKAKPKLTVANRDVVLYPARKVEVYEAPKVLTIDKIDQILGWTEDPVAAKEAGLDPEEPLLKVRMGDKETPVWCLNNNHNRPFVEAWARRIGHDVLYRHWADSRNGENRTLNGETIIIGRHGTVLSAQHRLIGTKLAELERLSDPEKYEHLWDGPISIETIVVYGIDESIETVRTLDNTKPRTFGDVLFADGTFGKISASRAKTLTKMAGHATHFLWNRLHITTKETHSEASAWLQSHPRLKDCILYVDKVNTENKAGKGKGGKGGVARYVSPAYAAALQYLMGTCGTDQEVYYGKPYTERSEQSMDFSTWEQAEAFWEMVAQSHPDLKGMRNVFAEMADEKGIDRGTLAEKVVVFIRAWNAFINDEKVTEKRCRPHYVLDDDTGVHIMVDDTLLGGLDRGDVNSDDPTEEEIEVEKERIRGERKAKPKKGKKGDKAKDEEEEDDEDLLAGFPGDDEEE